MPLLWLADKVVRVWLFEALWVAQFIAGGLGGLGCRVQPVAAWNPCVGTDRAAAVFVALMNSAALRCPYPFGAARLVLVRALAVGAFGAAAIGWRGGGGGVRASTRSVHCLCRVLVTKRSTSRRHLIGSLRRERAVAAGELAVDITAGLRSRSARLLVGSAAGSSRHPSRCRRCLTNRFRNFASSASGGERLSRLST